MTPFASVAILEKLALLKMALCSAPAFEERLFGLLAGGIVGADQQIADDSAEIVAQCGNRHDRRKAAAIFTDVSQLVNVFDAARGLEDQRLEARRNRGCQFDAQCFGAL